MITLLYKMGWFSQEWLLKEIYTQCYSYRKGTHYRLINCVLVQSIKKGN